MVVLAAVATLVGLLLAGLYAYAVIALGSLGMAVSFLSSRSRGTDAGATGFTTHLSN